MHIKKVALAIAAVALFPHAASAASLTTVLTDGGGDGTFDDSVGAATGTAGQSFSRETLLTDAARAVNFGGISLGYTPGIALTAGDTITFTFSRAPLQATGVGTATRAYPFQSLLSPIAGGGETGTLTLSAQTATSVTYTASGTIVDTATNDPGYVLANGDLIFAAGTGDVTVTATTANTAGIDRADDGEQDLHIDGGTDVSIAFDLATLAETVDVSATTPKTAFAGGGRTATFEIDVRDAAGDDDISLADSALGLLLSISGADFSWLDNDADTAGNQLTLGQEITVTDTDGGTTITPSIVASGTDFDEGTLVLSIADVLNTNNATNAISVSFTSPVANTAEIPEQTLSIAASLFSDEDSGTGGGTPLDFVPAVTSVTLQEASASAAYSLNGSSVSIYAVPVSNSVQNFIYLSNTSSTASGDVSVTVVDEGVAKGPYSLGTSEPNTEFDIGARFKKAVFDAGENFEGSRVRLDITTELPESNVVVSASYKQLTDSDRVNLLTSTESDHDN